MSHFSEHIHENIQSVILFGVAFLTHKLSLEEMDLIATVCFRVLSLISVIMVIIINFMAFSYSIRGAWVRFIRFINKKNKEMNILDSLKTKAVDYLIIVIFGGIGFYFTTQNQINNLKEKVGLLSEQVQSHEKAMQLMQIDFVKAVGELKDSNCSNTRNKGISRAFSEQLEKSLVKIDKLQTDLFESQRKYGNR